MPTTVLLVDDHAIFRTGLLHLLEKEADLRVVGETGDGQAAMELIRDLSPDVVVLDTATPHLDSGEAIKRILSESPQIRVVALAARAEEGHVDQLLRASARGYLLKESRPEEILDGIRTVARGEIWLSPAATGTVVSQYVDLLASESDPGEGHGLDTMDAASIARTKLHRPRAPLGTVKRARLLKQLDDGYRRPLTLVCAPAGYGKSTLVRQWLEESERPSAWLSLDDQDNDLRLFLAYFVAAVRTAFPEALQRTSALLGAPVLPPLRVLSGALTNEFERIGQPFTVVLDDYHLVQDVEIHDLFNELLRHPSHFLHLLLISRTEPGLDLLPLRARRQMQEIGFSDLRFTAAETATMLQLELGESVGIDIATLFTDRMEGWVTGMHLATLAMDNAADLEYIMTSMPGEQLTLDYMLAETLSRQPRAVQEWFLKSAILDRFCAPLCEAVCAPAGADGTGELDGTSFIHWLWEQNLFTIPLDHQRRWFRYHHLFRQLLLDHLVNSLEGHEIAGLHRRAGGWCVQNGLTEEAIEHALAAKDVPAAVQWVESYSRDLISRDQWHRLQRVLERFSPEEIEAHLETLILRAWLLYYQQRHHELEQTLVLAESLQASSLERCDRTSALLAEIYLIRSLANYKTLTGEEILLQAQHVLDRTSPNQIDARGQALKMQCLAYQRIGDLENALKIANAAIAMDTPEYAKNRARMLAILEGIHLTEADLFSAQRVAGLCLRHAEKYDLVEIRANAEWVSGVVAYQWNDLAGVAGYLGNAPEQLYTISPLQAIHSSFCLAATYQSQGKEVEARSLTDAVLDFALESAESRFLPEAEAFQAELALRQGRYDDAFRWARGYSYEQIEVLFYVFVPQLTLAWTLLVQDTAKSRRGAKTVLDQLNDFAVSRHNKYLHLTVQALLALHCHAQGDNAGAMQHLSDSLALAEPGGFIRTYVDLGPNMAYLLQQLAASGVAQDYIGRILDVFVAVPLPPEGTGQSKLIEPLTDREIEVLALFGQGLSYNESAQQLFVSPNTIKKHAKSTYEKLGVHQKRDAIAKAKALGILPQ